MALEIFIGFCRHRVCAGGVCRARQKPFGKKGVIVLILIAFVIAAVRAALDNLEAEADPGHPDKP